MAFRADNAREHACKPARAKVRLAKSCVCRSGEGLHLTLARSGQLSCCHVRYSFVYVDGCLLALVTGVLELVYLQPLALRKNVHQPWPLALNLI